MKFILAVNDVIYYMDKDNIFHRIDTITLQEDKVALGVAPLPTSTIPTSIEPITTDLAQTTTISPKIHSTISPERESSDASQVVLGVLLLLVLFCTL